MASRYLVPFSTGRYWGGTDPLLELHREMNRLFDDAFRGGGVEGGLSGMGAMTAPRLDVQESEGELRLKADVPGVQPGDLDVRIDGDLLTLSGERRSESNQAQQNYHVQERSHGRFQRTVQLPFAPDPQQVQADFEHGVLTIRLPRPAQQERSRRIEVRSRDTASALQGASPSAGSSGSLESSAAQQTGSAGGASSSGAPQSSAGLQGTEDDSTGAMGGQGQSPSGNGGRSDGAGAGMSH